VTTAGEITSERRTRQGVGYSHIEVFGPDGKVEFGIKVFDNGRVSIGSTRVSFALDRLHRHKDGSSVELLRSPLPSTEPENRA